MNILSDDSKRREKLSETGPRISKSRPVDVLICSASIAARCSGGIFLQPRNATDAEGNHGNNNYEKTSLKPDPFLFLLLFLKTYIMVKYFLDAILNQSKAKWCLWHTQTNIGTILLPSKYRRSPHDWVVITEIHGKVGLIRINRPEAMNALNNDVVNGISAAVDAFELDKTIGCIVLTRNEKAFAAGADIGLMKISTTWMPTKPTSLPATGSVLKPLANQSLLRLLDLL